MSHLSDATRGLELADAQLVAIQSRLASMHKEMEEEVNLLDLAIANIRGAGADILKHDCSVHLPRKK